MSTAFGEWVASYERAWRSPGTASLAELFTADATYSTAPFERPHEGLEAIAQMWEAEREGPDEPFEMTAEPVAVEGRTGVYRVEVRYGRPGGVHYRDLWVIELDDAGRCRSFEEWPHWPAGADGVAASGAAGGVEG